MRRWRASTRPDEGPSRSSRNRDQDVVGSRRPDPPSSVSRFSIGSPTRSRERVLPDYTGRPGEDPENRSGGRVDPLGSGSESPAGDVRAFLERVAAMQSDIAPLDDVAISRLAKLLRRANPAESA